MLPAANARALHACLARGLLIYLATGRPQRIACDRRAGWGELACLARSGVYYNGASAIDADTGYQRHLMIEGETVRAICDVLDRCAPHVQVALQIRNQYHSFRQVMDDEGLATWGFGMHELLEYREARGGACSKIVVADLSAGARVPSEVQWGDVTEAHAELQRCIGERARILLTDRGRCIQIIPAMASKESAVQALLERRRIAMDQVLVFGDDWADEGLLRTFEHSFAMANGPERLQCIARHIAPSHNEAGVAQVLGAVLGV